MRSKNEIMCDINYNQLSNQKIMLELLLDIRELLMKQNGVTINNLNLPHQPKVYTLEGD